MKNLIFLCCLLPLFLTAQTNLKGFIQYENTPIAYANVVASTSANEFILGAVTDEQGAFELALTDGVFIITVSHLNFSSKDTTIEIKNGLLFPNGGNLNVSLKDDDHRLEEVVVTTHKKIIRKKIDRTVIDISDNAMLASGNAFEAMRAAPGLAVNNESIVMLGKSDVRIAVDGRMVQLSGDALNAYLKAMPASEIKSIEVITNPPARYQAEGNSGIINIVTKRLKQDSWSNNLSLSHSQSKLGWQNFNNSFNLKKNKISLLANLAMQTGHQEFLQIVEPEYSNNPQKTISVQDRNLIRISPRLMLDYQLNAKTRIGAQFLTNLNRTRQFDDLETTIFNEEEVDAFLIAEDVEYFEDRNNTSYNIYLDRELDTLGGRLTFNLDLLDYQGNTKTKLFSNLFDENKNFTSLDFANQGDAHYDIFNLSTSLDIEKLIGKVKCAYGGSYNWTQTDYSLENFDLASGAPVFRSEASNTFGFEETIYGTYINAYRRFGEKWEAQAGLRGEYIDLAGNSDDNLVATNRFSSNYFNLFPTFYLNYNQSENHRFSINYGRRISRPAYSQLNPARSFLNGQSSQQGNPFLRPSFTQNIELSHIFRSNLNTTITLRQTEDTYSFVFDLNDETQEQLITYKNLFDEQALSITSQYEFSPMTRWTTQAFIYYGIGNSKKIKEADQIKLKNSGRLYASLNNQVHFNKEKTITGQANIWWDSPYSQNIYSFGKAYSLDLSITVRELIKGWTFTLGAYDIFNSSPRQVTSQINNVNHRFKAYPSNRYVRLYLAYSFGNKKINHQRRNFGNENIRGRSN